MMKTRFLPVILILLTAFAATAGTKVSQMRRTTTVASNDLFMMVRTVAGKKTNVNIEARYLAPGLGPWITNSGSSSGGGSSSGLTNVDQLNDLVGRFDWNGRGPNTNAPDVIVDADPGGDSDDAADATLAAALHNLGLINLRAYGHSSSNDFGAGCISAMLANKGIRIPVGISKVPTGITTDVYGSYVETNFNGGSKHWFSNSLDAVDVYRYALASSADSNVVFITTGPLYNIQRLIDSPADFRSPLTGSQLLKRKLRPDLGLVVVACTFTNASGLPNTPEFNVLAHVNGLVWVNNYVPNSFPVTWFGVEVFGGVQTGVGYATNLSQLDPLYQAFRLSGVNGRPGWAQGAFLMAAMGTNFTYGSSRGSNVFGFSSGGTNQIVSGGSNIWWSGTYVGQKYATLLADTNWLAGIVNSLIMPSPNNAKDFIPRSGGALINGGDYNFANGATATFTNLTPDRVALLSPFGKVTNSPNVTAAELEFLDGVTSPIQTQLLAVSNAAVSLLVANDTITSNGVVAFELTRNAAVSNSLATLLVANDTTTSNGLYSIIGTIGGTNTPNVNLLGQGTNAVLVAGTSKAFLGETNGNAIYNLSLAVPVSGQTVFLTVSNRGSSTISVTLYTNSAAATARDIQSSTTITAWSVIAGGAVKSKLVWTGSYWERTVEGEPLGNLIAGYKTELLTNGQTITAQSTQRYTNYADANIVVSAATDVTANYTNAVAGNRVISLHTPVIGTSGTLALVSDSSARTLTLLCTNALITWISTNDTASATNILTTASKRSLLCWRVSMGTDGVSTNIGMWVKNQTP